MLQEENRALQGATAATPGPQTEPGAPDWWRCQRQGPVSGTYRGEMVGPRPGSHILELRVDVDPHYGSSPVLERLSGDIYQRFSFRMPDGNNFSWKVYRESWIVEQPQAQWARCQVIISGRVHWWKGIHPETKIEVTIPWSSTQAPGPATVLFKYADDVDQNFVCDRYSDFFRQLTLEVDVVRSASKGRTLPEYDTHLHEIRPHGLPRRVLTVQEAYREAGVELTIRADRTIIDDSAGEFQSWSPAELHAAMEDHFSEFNRSWPRWEMWGLLAGSYDNPRVGGIMFDAAAAFSNRGMPSERQGFAVFRNHDWFKQLPDGPPTSQDEAAALRQFLYTWVHEAGHAFNFLHSWDKNRPDSLSWMNYDWRYDRRNGEDSFWRHFQLRFDDEELIHLRHGDRAAVIMGGDPWASGGHVEGPPGADHLEAPPGALSQAEGTAPLELLIRSKGYYAFMEPVEIELRLRNLLADLPVQVDTQLDPAYGGIIIYIKRPDGRIMEYEPVMCNLAQADLEALKPGQHSVKGEDRYSQQLFVSYGRYGFYFDVPGDYLVRALYQGPGDMLIPSDIHRLRVGHPTDKDEDRIAQDFFSYDVGMSLYLRGSQSPHLQQGMNTLRELASRFGNSMVGAKAADVVARSVASPFFQVEEKDKRRVLRQAHAPQPEEAVKITEPILALYQQASGPEAKALNLGYHDLVRKRAQYLKEADNLPQAKQELRLLHSQLAERGVNQPVLQTIKEYAERI